MARPWGTLPDIGAFELGSETPVPLSFSIPDGLPPENPASSLAVPGTYEGENVIASAETDEAMGEGDQLTDAELFEWSLQVNQYTDAQLQALGFSEVDIDRMRFFAANPDAYQVETEGIDGADQDESGISQEDAVEITAQESAAAAVTPVPIELIGQIPTVESYPITVERFIQVGDEVRRFLVFLPSNTPGLPVVFSLHGWGFPPEDMQEWTSWNDVATREGIIIVYPEARVPELLWQFSGDNVFFNDILDVLERDYSPDMARVYVSGFSAGGFMAHYLAGVLNDRITAVASVEGLVPGPELEVPPRPQRPVPVVMIHNRQDAIIPYEDVGDSIDTWVVWNDCDPVPESRRYSSQVDWDIYHNCAGGVRVELYTFESPLFDGHFIPWEDQGIDAAEALWAFFSQFSRD